MPNDSVVAAAIIENDLTPISKSEAPVDNSTIFLTFLSFLGDVPKTAAALGITQSFISDLAVKEAWAPKVEALLVLKREQGADALARELNRVVNYVQAVRLRNIIDRTLRRVTADDDAFENFITNHGKENSNTTCKTLAELMKAAQIAHLMTYAALGDTCGERIQRDDDTGVSSGLLRSLAKIAGKAQDPIDIDSTKVAREGLLQAPVTQAVPMSG